MSRQKEEDRISKLLEDVSTPELSCSEEDPYCDDGEYGSDRDFEPYFNKLSSDSDVACPRKRQRRHPSEYNKIVPKDGLRR